ncbi:hypothetical protein ACFCWD_22865 [Streptomyces sp. NPDC056374]|uniref:hypothetical protein n=1 Tax=unclassified Streptomyces TaxID=2593676 RepID=UPI0035E27D62
MAANLYDRSMSDHEYVQRVRRHRPSALLPLVAATSARWKENSFWHSPYRKYTPWALADIARVALAYGNEHRGDGTCTERDLLHMLAAYAALDDPMLRQENTYEAFLAFMLRLSGEQLVHQESTYNALARTAALFEQTEPTRAPRCLKAGWDEDLLGCSLSHYVGVTMLLQVSTYQNAGRFDPAWLDQPQGRELCEILPADIVRRVTEAHFVTDQPIFKAENERLRISKEPRLRRFEYNPLRGRPFLRGYGPGYLAPSSHLIASKGSPLGLYYMGVAQYGNAFAEDLGDLFEQYVGRNLREISSATVHPEIVYRDNRRSVDWIVVMDNLVLLVEVKSTRPTQHMRLGVLDRTSAVRRQLTHAYKQLDTTADLIKKRHPDFTHIPDDRPLQGLVVTMEKFHTVNAHFQRGQHPRTDTFTTVCSAQELEHLVTVEGEAIDQMLLERQTDAMRSTYSLNEILTGKRLGRNRVLDAGWHSYPWMQHPRLQSGAAADGTA